MQQEKQELLEKMKSNEVESVKALTELKQRFTAYSTQSLDLHLFICRLTEANSAERLEELQAKVAELEQSLAEKAAEIAKLQADKVGLEVVLERERKNSVSSMSSDCKKVSLIKCANRVSHSI